MCLGWQSHDRARDNVTHPATAPLLPSHNAIPVEAHTSPCLPHCNTPSQHHVTIPQGQYRYTIPPANNTRPSPDLSPLTARIAGPAAPSEPRPGLDRDSPLEAAPDSPQKRPHSAVPRTALAAVHGRSACTGATALRLKGGPHQPRWRSRALGAVQGTSGSVQYLSVHFYVS